MPRAALVLLLLLLTLPARGQAPLLEGRFDVDVAAGLFRGDVCVSGLPQQPTHAFVLNRGLNIRDVRDAATGRLLAYEGGHDAVGVGDGTRYTTGGPVGEAGFCVRYVGAYPVYRVDEGERAVDDWKGWIAFDGRTVRAAEQSRFYPVVEDPASGAHLDAVRYAVEVDCGSCTAIYLGGSAPAAGPRAAFASEVPRPLFLYAGDFPFATVAGVHFVGAAVEAEDAAAIGTAVDAVARTHAAYLGAPYDDVPAYLTFASVSRSRTLGRTSWGFVTWPTIAMDGRAPFDHLTTADSTTGRRVLQPDLVGFLAHEMAHYYFGTRFVPSGPLRFFLLESTAEFMAMRAVRSLVGEDAYGAIVRRHLGHVERSGAVVPLDAVRASGQIDEAYRYTLGPLLLVALQEHVGDAVLRRALRSFVADPPRAPIDYDLFRTRLEAAGAGGEALERFEAACLVARPLDGCLAALAAGVPSEGR